MKHKLNTMSGDRFGKVAEEAKQIATNKNVTVEFEFNDIICLVNKDTNLEWLHRDYSNAWLMDWKVVGTDCLPSYEPEVQAEYERRSKERAEKRAIQEAEYKAK